MDETSLLNFLIPTINQDEAERDSAEWLFLHTVRDLRRRSDLDQDRYTVLGIALFCASCSSMHARLSTL
jgi:hypothetical protein